MEIRRLYSKLNQITKLEHYNSFSFSFHGGILNWPEKTNDIDIKLVPQSKPITIQMVNKTMKELTVKLDLAPVFFNKVEMWDGKFRPTLQEIDTMEPVLQAVYGRNLEELLDFNQEIDKMYLYRNGVRYRKIGNLIFCKSAEWAVCGHKYNENWKELEAKKKSSKSEMERLHQNNYLSENISKYEMVKEVEIREFLKEPIPDNWEEFKNKFRRIL